MNLISALAARDTGADAADAASIVSALYAEHALGLTRLAQVGKIVRDFPPESGGDPAR